MIFQKSSTDSEGSSKQLLYRAGLWGSQHLYYLNFFTCNLKALRKVKISQEIFDKIQNLFTTHMQKWSNIINSVKISKLAHIIEIIDNLTYQHCLQIRINCWSDGVRSNCSSTAGIFVIVTCCRLHSFSKRLTVSCKGVFTTYLEKRIFIKISSRHPGGTQLPGNTQGTPRRYPGDSQ